jgi:poly(A) polymerase
MEDEILAIKSDTSRLLNEISRFLAAKQIPAYIVGGFMRDALLGRETVDIDIAIAADALEIASKVADFLGGKFVPLDEANKVGRVILPDAKYQLDFVNITHSNSSDI